MHQLFFPPRLKVVIEQQQSDSLAPYSADQLTFDGFFGNQTDRPAGETRRRLAANHGNDALPLRCLQCRLSTGSRAIVECCIQATRAIAPTDVSNRGCRKAYCVSRLRRRLSLIQQQQSASALYDTYWLNPTPKESAK